MLPVIRACERQKLPFFIIHTGQHYSYEMDKIFFQELELPSPRYSLDVGSGPHGEQTGAILTRAEPVLLSEKPGIVLVQGDTNTVAAGAMAAIKLHIPVGHIEAGLRSFDRRMPEEINRIIADHISSLLFPPTQKAQENLENEGIKGKNVLVTGNTIVDAVNENLIIARKKVSPLRRLGLSKGAYVLVTSHRTENVDSPVRLKGILEGLSEVHNISSMPVLFPVHPRTSKMIKTFGYEANGVIMCEPVGFLEFLILEENSRLIITDSGGVQEEACILGVPCVTIRDSTERPETIEVGANVLAGTSPANIVSSFKQMMDVGDSWENPFGDGKAGERIVATCRLYL